MNYERKYLKYKTKFLQLKNVIKKRKLCLEGGGKAGVEVLKNINLFEKESDIEKHLNPVYGFLWSINAITNYYNFHNSSYNTTAKLIRSAFYIIPNTPNITLTNNLENVSTYDFGRFLGYMYMDKVLFQSIREKIDYINKILKSIKSYNNLVSIKKSISENEGNAEHQNKKLQQVTSALKNISQNVRMLIETNFEDNNILVQGYPLQINNEQYNGMADMDKVNSVLNNYVNMLKVIVAKPEYDPLIDRYMNNNIGWDTVNNEELLRLFRIVLVAVWHNAGDKRGIMDYYRGINSVVTDTYKVTIPENYETDVFLHTDLYKPSTEYYYRSDIITDYYLALALMYLQTMSSLTLLQQRTTNVQHPCPVSYSDCGSSSLRNFIQIIAYDFENGVINLDVIEKLGGVQSIIKYFTLFNTNSKQTSNDKEVIFGVNQNPRDAWGTVTCDLDGVKYNKSCDTDTNKNYKCEIKSGNSDIVEEGVSVLNILQAIRQLFTNIKTWSDFSNIVGGLNIKVNVNDDGFGEIIININSKKFTWHLKNGHFYTTEEKSPTDIIVNNTFSSEEIFYLQMFYVNTGRILAGNCGNGYSDGIPDKTTDIRFNSEYYSYVYEDGINLIGNEWINFLKFSTENVIIMFNIEYNVQNSDKYYTSIFEYIMNTFDNDQKERTFVNLDKLSTDILNKYDLSPMGYEYDNSGNKSVENIVGITYKDHQSDYIGSSLNRLINLQRIKLGEIFTEDISGTFDKLTNLRELTFGNYFSNPLGDSLKPLINLEKLTLGSAMNEPLNDSLINLVNLKELVFGHRSATLLENSLNTLTSLEKLTLGFYFNKPLGDSLKSLTNLRELKLGGLYNQPIENSLQYLTKLETLDMGESYNIELGDSLKPLKELKVLVLGSKFNRSLGDSIDKLEKLESLIIGDSYNMKFKTSLNNLVNLRELVIGHSFNHPFKNSLENQTNLRKLVIGNGFNSELRNSFHTLTQLEELVFGDSFNIYAHKTYMTLKNLKVLKFGWGFTNQGQPLGNSFENLTSLEILNMGCYNNSIKNSFSALFSLKSLAFLCFNKPIENSFDTLTLLESITFSSHFNQPLKNSLQNLTALQSVIFGRHFNQPLDSSLSTLVNLRTIEFGSDFKQDLGTSLSTLINLEKVVFGYEFDRLLNETFKNHTKLKEINVGKSCYLRHLDSKDTTLEKILVYERAHLLRNQIVYDEGRDHYDDTVRTFYGNYNDDDGDY